MEGGDGCCLWSLVGFLEEAGHELGCVVASGAERGYGSKEEEVPLADKTGEQNEEPAHRVNAGWQVLGVESR